MYSSWFYKIKLAIACSSVRVCLKLRPPLANPQLSFLSLLFPIDNPSGNLNPHHRKEFFSPPPLPFSPGKNFVSPHPPPSGWMDAGGFIA